MNNNMSNPQTASFFVPIGIGVLVQMFCAGLVTTVTATRFSSPGSADSVAQSVVPDVTERSDSVESEPTPEAAERGTALAAANSSEPAASADPIVDAPMLTDNSAADSIAGDAGSPAIEASPAEVTSAAADAPVEAQPAAQPEAPPRPLDDVRTRSRLMTIAGEGLPDEIELCQISVADVTNVALELIGGEYSNPRSLTLQLDRQPIDANSCTWSVMQVAATGFDRVQAVGEFLLRDQRLSFRWLKNADKGKLPFCRLKISADADMEICDLWSPVRAAALRVNFKDRVQKLPPFVPPGVQLPPAEALQAEFTLEGWPENQQSRDTLIVNEVTEIAFPDADSDRDLLQIQLTLKLEGGQLAVHASCFTSVPESSSRRGKGEITYKDTPLDREELEKLIKGMETAAARYQREVLNIDKDLGKLQAAQDNLDKLRDAGPRPDLAAKQDMLDSRAEDLAEKKSAAEELVTVFSDAHAAMTKLTGLCDEIEETGRIHFQLIRPLDGGAANVVIASSIGAAAVD